MPVIAYNNPFVLNKEYKQNNLLSYRSIPRFFSRYVHCDVLLNMITSLDLGGYYQTKET